jgi:predicted lactoylglutathione lyase
MFTIALPTSDRPTTHRFYTEALGLEAFGEPADDGVPEPLQLRLSDDVSLMFIPTGGFGMVTEGHETAAPGVSECLLSLVVETDEDADAAVARAVAAGATIVNELTQKPWGYLGTFTDPDQHLWQVIHPT